MFGIKNQIRVPTQSLPRVAWSACTTQGVTVGKQRAWLHEPSCFVVLRWLSARYYMRRVSPVDGWCDEPRETEASFILERRRHDSLDILRREVVVLKTDTTRMRRMIITFPSSWRYYLLHLGSWMDFYICPLAGLMSRADPANAITEKRLSPVSRDPDPRYRQFG